jgi:hypothetical protein
LHGIDDFVLIDLTSQRHAVAKHIASLHEEAKLEWLRQRGELTELCLEPTASRTFVFRSCVGLEARFFLREQVFTFLGDHMVIP